MYLFSSMPLFLLSFALFAPALLGVFSCGEPAPDDLLGTWGGRHVALTVTEEGAVLEFDCARGAIDTPIVPDEAGRFRVAGTYRPERGGPVREGDQPEPQRAAYVGEVEGDVLTLTVTLPEADLSVGTFSLKRGAEPRLFKCL